MTNGINVILHNVIGKKGSGKGQFRNATSVSHVSSGSIIVTDIINCRVTLFHGSGRVISELQTGQGSEPWATAVLPNGKFVVSLQKPGCLAIFSPNGESCKQIASHLLVKPSGVATDRKGRIVVSDVNLDAVYILDEEGMMVQKLGQEPVNADATQEVRRRVMSKLPQEVVQFTHEVTSPPRHRCIVDHFAHRDDEHHQQISRRQV